MSPTAYVVVLALNVAWFSAGFWSFGMTPRRSAKIVVPSSLRQSPLFATLAESLRFLGGMNFAFAVFSLLCLLCMSWFPEARQRALFAAVFAIAHASQFVANLPVAFSGGRQGESYWDVLKGPMLFIFSVDAALMLANGLLAALLLAA
ncbi:hypothetical protein [Polaromonas sp.]|uniref:hypothetical protein n=1 Tax=Polaromonas sp. TaxID=1869339 RepID=UPI003265802B